MKVPVDILPFEIAACCKEIFLSHHLLQKFGDFLKRGDGVAINAASSLVGQMVIQMGKLLGLRVIAIIRRSDASFERAKAYLLELGATLVFEENEPIKECLDAAHQSLPKLACDAVGGPTGMSKLLDVVADGAKIVTFGSLGGPKIEIPFEKLLMRDVTIQSFNVVRWLEHSKNQSKFVDVLQSMSKLIAHKRLIVNCKCFPLLSITDALTHYQQPNRINKIVLQMHDVNEEALLVEQLAEIEKEEKVKYLHVEENLFKPFKPSKVSEPLLPCLEVCHPKSSSCSASMIFLHGEGEVPEEYDMIFRSLIERSDNELEHCRICLPSAENEFKINEEEGPCWFDPMLTPSIGGSEITRRDLDFLVEIDRVSEAICNIVQKEMQIISSKNPEDNTLGQIVLAGFGQGALIALSTALKLKLPCGVCAFGIPNIEKKLLDVMCQNGLCPNSKIWLLTGSEDTVNPLSCPNDIKKILKCQGLSATVNPIPYGKHEVGDVELAHLSSVLNLLIKH
eukprot:GHVL01024488.1.p1 GENE.GHVL01024488.1~~GHVL01024488.1.p1  ORF type:complete len:508 (+),score=97.53 GHVL01024488.1:1045-2568(+)